MKKKYVLFWINSNRGTHHKAVFEIPKYARKEGDFKAWKEYLKDRLESWCSRFGAWTHGDNTIEYGYKVITIPKRKELLKSWDKICARKHKLDNEYQIMQAMFNPCKMVF